MALLNANGIQIYFEDHGSGPQTIVFAHGKGGNHLSWWQQVPHFLGKYRCITLDHRSYGLSTNCEDGRNQEAFVDDLKAVLDHLEVDECFLVGQSMGGRTCLDFSIRYPDRVKALVLASTIAGVVDPELQDILGEHARPPKELLVRVLSERFRKENRDLTHLFAQIEALNHVGKDPFPLLIKGASKSDVEACKVPSLLIVGDEDLVAPPPAVEWLAKAMPNSTMYVIQDTGHSIYFERPEVFNDLIDKFFSTVN